MDRRHFLNATFAGIATSVCPHCVGAANAQGLGYVDEELLCGAASSLKASQYTRVLTTGNRNLDNALASEMKKQQQLYILKPAFYIFTDLIKNAFATTRKFPEYPASDGSIVYGIELMKEQLARGYWGGAVVAGVLAHEYGHIFQYRSGYFRKLRKMHKTVKFVELHADYLSGYYIGRKYKESGERVNVRTVASATYDIGDYSYNSPQHHGTPIERTIMLKAGFDLHNLNPRLNINQVAAQAFSTIKKLYFKNQG